jgi:hypothetical protein
VQCVWHWLLGSGASFSACVQASTASAGRACVRPVWNDAAILGEHQHLVAEWLGEPAGGAHLGWQRPAQARRPLGWGCRAVAWGDRQDR